MDLTKIMVMGKPGFLQKLTLKLRLECKSVMLIVIAGSAYRGVKSGDRGGKVSQSLYVNDRLPLGQP